MKWCCGLFYPVVLGDMSLDVSGLAFAFTAGVLSVFSPCGYALLPGYVSYYMGSKLSVVRAASGGLACTLGLVTVFSAFGALTSSLGTVLSGLVPTLGLLAGGVTVAMGAATLFGVGFPRMPFTLRPSRRTGLSGFYLFGIVYGLAGVGCSAPIFVSVIVFAMLGGLANGVLTFVAYAAGMGLPLVVTSVLVAQANELVLAKISGVTPRLQMVGGVVLMLAGFYLLWFNLAIYF